MITGPQSQMTLTKLSMSQNKTKQKYMNINPEYMKKSKGNTKDG